MTYLRRNFFIIFPIAMYLLGKFVTTWQREGITDAIMTTTIIGVIITAAFLFAQAFFNRKKKKTPEADL